MPDAPAEPRNGRIITFYSYKGGTGRTMALANVAWILAANGYRVLAADWDLEAPGLHRFLYPFLEQVAQDTPGIIDLIREYEWAAASSDDEDQLARQRDELARVKRYAFSLNWDFPGGGTLDFLSPGRQDLNYVATLGAMDWDTFYADLKGGKFLDALRQDMKRHYDYVLIDSRTGLTDIADICTVHLPDILVDCFALSTQGIEGAARVARLVRDRYEYRSIRILPVAMRVDPAEKDKLDAGRAFARQLFAGLPAGMSEAQRRDYWTAMEVPYQPFYAYEETLAVFGDAPGAPSSLLSSFERIAAQVTDGVVTKLPEMDEDLRIDTKLLFARKLPQETSRIAVEFLPEDRIWAEWIAAVLTDHGFTVRERPVDSPAVPAGEDPASSRTLTVVSAAYIAQRNAQLAGQPSPSRSGLAAYVAATQPLAEFPPTASVFLAGVPVREAVERLLKLLGIGPAVRTVRLPGSRYPAAEPKILKVNARNTRFTGREKDLRELREQLRGFGTAVVLPVTLHGLGGIGKTQVALEYVHRFKNDYDLVWWIDCGQPQFIDSALADLCRRMQKEFELAIPAGATVEEMARLVLDTLQQGRSELRWLLVYDNAEDIGAVQLFLPRSGGHILITSRNASWADQARSLPVELFAREESIAHLCQVVPSLTASEADEVAEELGDLPLAIALAAAWLAETSYSVSDYLNELRRAALQTLSVSQLADYPQGVLAAWEPSLNLLQERSPAAARLLELCSVMAPGVGLDLIYTPAVARILEPLDARLSEPMIIGRVVQEINRLALVRLDPGTNQIQLHRLVQAVVQSRMSPGQLASARSDVHQILVAARPRRDVDDPDTWNRYRLIWPHLAPSGAVSSLEEPVRQLFIDRVRFLRVASDLDRAGDEAVEIASQWEEMLATAEPAVARSLRRQLLQLRSNLGDIRRFQSRFEEARALDESALAGQTELLGEDHPHTLITAGGLAADLRGLGHYREALQRDLKTYPAWTELYGPDHRRTLAAANNLAVSLRVTGDVAAALERDADTLARTRATLGAQHPSTLLSARNVARDLLEAGEYAEAVVRMEAVYRSCADVLGADSPAALDAQVVLGIALRSAGRPHDAEPQFLDALRGLTDRYGETGSAPLACGLSHATNLLALDRIELAESSIRDVLAEYEHRMGATHPHTLVCQVNLASALRLRGEYAAATEIISAATSGLEEVLGVQHPYTLAAAMVLGTLLADVGELGRAAEAEDRTARGLESALGPNHPDTLRCRANLLLTREALEDEAAAAERDSVISQLAAVIGPDHPNIDTLRARRRLLRALDPQPF